jgi:gas vesicle protein
MDVKLSKEYRALWADARKKNTLEALEDVYEQLMDELGIQEPENNERFEKAAREIADRRNERDSGKHQKRL